MRQDLETNSFIGKGEDTVFYILKQLTNLSPRNLKEYPKSGIYRQVPISKIISKHDYSELSQSHQNGSLDLFIIFNQKKIAIRVQGSGHGKFLKGLGKSQHDKVQEKLLKQYCEVVDILKIECKHIFQERITSKARQELIDSFKTAGVMIPVL